MRRISRYAAWVWPRFDLLVGAGMAICLLLLCIGMPLHRAAPVASDVLMVLAGTVMLASLGSGLLALALGGERTCSRCQGKGYLVNVALRVLEDCPCQGESDPQPASLGGRSRPSGLSERARTARLRTP